MRPILVSETEQSSDLYSGGNNENGGRRMSFKFDDLFVSQTSDNSALDALAQHLEKMNQTCRARQACGPKGFRPFR